MTRAGSFDREVSVYRKSVTQDTTYGTEIVTWVPLAPVAGSPTLAERWRANVQDVLPSRAESSVQGLNVSRNPARLRLRWRNDMDSSMRVTLHGDTDLEYQIVSGPAEYGGRKEQVEFMMEQLSS